MNTFSQKLIGTFAVAMLVAFACIGAVAATDDARTFTDDLGRTVTLPAEIGKVIPSGILAISALVVYDPKYLASCGTGFPATSAKYLPKFAALNLPKTGSLLGSVGAVNYEEVMCLEELGVDLYIDAGQKKGNVAESLDGFTKTSGLPAVFISQDTLSDIPDSYKKIGDLLGETERGEELYAYLKGWIDTFEEGMKKVDKATAVEITQIDGNSLRILGGFNDQNTYGSQATPICTLAENCVPAKTNKGIGDEYGMEEALKILQEHDPEFIFIDGTDNHAYYTAFLANPIFANLSAVTSGKVYEIPADCPYTWISHPFSGWSICGMIWMANIMYPEVFDYSAKDKIQEFYKTMIGYELSDAEYNDLTQTSPSAASPAPILGILAGLGIVSLVVLRRK